MKFEKNKEVDAYLKRLNKWQAELTLLRDILVNTNLKEEVKWGAPCYTHDSKNLVLIQGFKNHCLVMFFKGVLLKDEKGILQQNGTNAQASKRIEFTSIAEIKKAAPQLRAFIKEAIKLEDAGVKVEYKTREKLVYPAEFQKYLKADAKLKTAFEKLTPGRQRAYNLFFSGAKQSETRDSRVQKCIPKILCGKGIDDCTCGLTKRPPYCDGSHKILKSKK